MIQSHLYRHNDLARFNNVESGPRVSLIDDNVPFHEPSRFKGCGELGELPFGEGLEKGDGLQEGETTDSEAAGGNTTGG